MNISFLNIVKRIVAEQGESILENADRLKSFIKDYAQNEPQEERRAFGRCIEQGFYRKFKNAATADKRKKLKSSLARQLQSATGMEATLCRNALDLLDAAIPLPASYTPSANYVSASKKKPAALIAVAVVISAIIVTLIVYNAFTTSSSGNASTTSPSKGGLSAWQGYTSFEDFTRAVDIDVFFGELLDEDSFIYLMRIALWGSILIENENIQFDIVRGQELTKKYGVSEALRQNNMYLVKDDSKNATYYIAYSYNDKWVVMSYKEKP